MLRFSLFNVRFCFISCRHARPYRSVIGLKNSLNNYQLMAINIFHVMSIIFEVSVLSNIFPDQDTI